MSSSSCCLTSRQRCSATSRTGRHRPRWTRCSRGCSRLGGAGDTSSPAGGVTRYGILSLYALLLELASRYRWDYTYILVLHRFFFFDLTWLLGGLPLLDRSSADEVCRSCSRQRSGRTRAGPHAIPDVVRHGWRCALPSFVRQTPVQQRHVQLLGRSVDLTHRVSGAMNRKISEVSDQWTG